MDVQAIHDMLHLGNFFGEVFGLLAFFRTSHRALKREGAVICGDLNLF
jgi:hypothetical protein